MNNHSDTPDLIARAIRAVLMSIYRIIFPPKSIRLRIYRAVIKPAIIVSARFFLNLIPEPTPATLDNHIMPSPTVTLTHPPRFSTEDVHEILIIKCDHVGDFFLAFRAFSIIRNGFPNSHITLMCSSWNRAVGLRSGFFDRIVCADISHEVSGHGPAKFDASVISSFNLPVFDIAVDLKVEGDTRFLLSHVQSHLKAGFEADKLIEFGIKPSFGADSFSFVLPAPSLRAFDGVNYARHTQACLTALSTGIVNLFNSTDEASSAFHHLLKSQPHSAIKRLGRGPIIGLCTASGSPTKNWPLDRFLSLTTSMIKEWDATIVLFGSKHCTQDGEFIEFNTGSENLVNLIGKIDLPDLASSLSKVDLYLGHDTGGTHLAALIGRRTVCLHAGTSPLEAFGPVGKNVSIVRCVNLPCSPCGLRELDRCGRGHECMQSISEDFVMHEIAGLLDLSWCPCET